MRVARKERAQALGKAAQPFKEHAIKAAIHPSAPVHPILRLQHTIGNQAMQRLLRSRAVQAKLRISQPGDMYEQEADRVAEQVMRMPTPIVQRACAPCAASGLPCPKCENEKIVSVRRKTEPVVHSTDTSVPDNFLQNLGRGRPLDLSTRGFFESRFGYDFSHVRVHADAQAADSARSANALAYTVGRNVVFGAGQYAPNTDQGGRLLAHELTHVVQQGSHRFGRMNREATPFSVSFLLRGGQQKPTLQRKAECSLKHVEDECNNAAASCKTVEEECKKRYPKPENIDAMIKKGRDKAKEQAVDAPNASANMLHFLGNTGVEKIMPTGVFESHKETKAALMRHREKFLEGAKKRLESGTLLPGAESEQMVYTDTANAFSIFSKDDLGYAVGGYTLCSKVRVKAKKIDTNKFEISFVDWTVQAFDCYNWDPGKGVGIPGASDTDMCCIENAGKGKHFRIRTDEWKNSHPESMKNEEITATLPSSPKVPVPAPAPPVFPPVPPPPPVPPGK